MSGGVEEFPVEGGASCIAGRENEEARAVDLLSALSPAAWRWPGRMLPDNKKTIDLRRLHNNETTDKSARYAKEEEEVWEEREVRWE